MIFSKYYANGNDFVIAQDDDKYQEFMKGKDKIEFIKLICNRYKGIGADGFIEIKKDYTKHTKFSKDLGKIDFAWEFYNLDGSLASMCGNGSRAAAHFAYTKGIADASMTFLTGAGVIKASVDGDMVEVCLGELKKEPKEVEFMGRKYYFTDSGVPHIVNFVDDVKSFDKSLCVKLRNHFNANVNYVQIVDKNTLKVRTYERGVEDETLACGTGMGASFYFARRFGVEDKATIYPTSLEEVYFRYDDEKLYFKGKVIKSFEAKV